jgi:hypothetical protein
LLVAHVGPWPRVPAQARVRMQRWRGHRPPPHAGVVGRPPRSLHAPRMRPPPRAPLSCAALVRRRSIPSTSTPPRAARCSALLPLIAFLGREDLPGASPLCPNPGLVFTFPSTTEPWGTSPTSPFSLMSATPTPHRRTPPLECRCRGELLTVSFPSFHHPKSDP